jgi:hypothetical protein
VEIIMVDDKIDDNIYCVCMIRLMISFIVCVWYHLLHVEIIMVDDKIDDNIYCLCMIRLMITFIVCGNYYGRW